MPPQSHQGKIAEACWDPGQYLKFSDHRLRPALELLERAFLASAGVIFDLGCGTGKVTAAIADRWPEAKVWGVDHSREMLTEAAEAVGRVQWTEADIRIRTPAAQGLPRQTRRPDPVPVPAPVKETKRYADEDSGQTSDAPKGFLARKIVKSPKAIHMGLCRVFFLFFMIFMVKRSFYNPARRSP